MKQFNYLLQFRKQEETLDIKLSSGQERNNKASFAENWMNATQ